MPNFTQRHPTDDWDYTNCERKGGRWRTRRSLLPLYTATSGSEIVFAQSYVPSFVDSLQTIILERSFTSGEVDLVCLDENYGEMWRRDYLCAVRPRSVRFIELGARIILASPDFATLIGYSGGELWEATKGTPYDPRAVALEIPRGIAVASFGRLAIADDDIIHWADPLRPTAFTTNNELNPPGGSIRGMEIDGAGNLVIITTDGSWSVPRSAGFKLDVRGILTRLDEHGVHGWDQTTSWGGGVFALDPGEGLREVGVGTKLKIGHFQGASGTLSSNHFRAPDSGESSRVSSSPGFGMMVRGGGGTWFSLGGAKGSWWTHTAVIEGVIGGVNGAPVVWARDGLHALGGRHGVTGGYSGRVNKPIDTSPKARSVHVGAAAGGVSCTVRTDVKGPATKTLSSRRTIPLLWGTEYIPSGSSGSQQFNLNERGDEVLLEVAFASGDVELADHVAIEWVPIGDDRDGP